MSKTFEIHQCFISGPSSEHLLQIYGRGKREYFSTKEKLSSHYVTGDTQ